MNRILPAAIAGALITGAPAMAQSSIDANHKHSWGENIGWLNWRDAGSPPSSRGVRVHASCLSGYIWGENVGWINLGDGTPASGHAYANITGADSGVNLAPGGLLSGLAWGENIGWINFSGGGLATPARPARLDRSAARLRGCAWAENVGWLDFDHAQYFVGVTICAADVNRDGAANSQDFFDFLAAFFASDPGADFNADGGITSQDFFDFLALFFSGC